jgi:DNA modification methylase
MMMMMEKAGLPIRHILIWVKDRACFSFGRLDYEYQHEPILYTWNKKHNFYGLGQYRTSIWNIKKEMKCDLHPTMKPVDLVINAIMNSTLENQIVGDFFAGSGTSLIACEKTGRRARLVEKDPHYCDIIVQRYSDWCIANNKEPIIRKNNECNL